MTHRETIYFGTSGFIIFLALASTTAPTARYTGVPFIFLFPAGTALAWFVEQSLEIVLKLRILIWSCLGLSGLLWANLAVAFFFKSTAP
jgi:hypothetical protein